MPETARGLQGRLDPKLTHYHLPLLGLEAENFSDERDRIAPVVGHRTTGTVSVWTACGRPEAVA